MLSLKQILAVSDAEVSSKLKARAVVDQPLENRIKLIKLYAKNKMITPEEVKLIQHPILIIH